MRTIRRCCRWLPSVLVMAPLVGLAFVADERRSVYLRALTNDANPFRAAMDAARGTDNFFSGGNFRPVGRFWEMLVHGFVYEAGEATAVAPHIVLGALRLTLVAVMALGATAMVSALARSAGVQQHASLAGLYPLALGAVLIANGTSGALAQLPHTLIGSAVLIVWIAVATSRDRDLRARPLRWHEYAAMVSVGALAAMFYDLAYLAPLIAAVFLAARCFASRMTLRAALATAATRRWVAQAAGFAAVFVPIRIAIAFQCSDGGCYEGSDLSLSADAFSTAWPRLLTGFPAIGWHFNEDLARSAGVELGLADLAANALLALVVVGIVVLAAAAAWQRPVPDTLGTLHGCEAAAGEGTGSSGRLAGVLLLLGGSLAVLSASVAGLTAWAQQRQPPVGQAWRETLLTQVAWSLVIAAGLAVLDLALRGRATNRIVRGLVAATLALAMSMTLLANWRFAEISRRDPDAVLTSLVSLSAVNMDDTPGGNAVRCALIDAYAEATIGQPAWTAGQAIGENLNDLTLERRGVPFCDPNRPPPAPQSAQDPG